MPEKNDSYPNGHHERVYVGADVVLCEGVIEIMKRYLWLLAVPYFVVHSTNTDSFDRPQTRSELKQSDVILEKGMSWSILQYECPVNYKCNEYVDDLAEALNEAHERRVARKNGVGTLTPPKVSSGSLRMMSFEVR